jgi:tetratricopeptide (TPR) repeat protein
MSVPGGTQPTQCSKCGSNDLRWTTLRKGRAPVDVLQCRACGTAAAEDSWDPPLRPLFPGRCWNCGEKRDLDSCVNCKLSRQEDIEVHDELRFMVDPQANHLKAARAANARGRRLLALKLATASAATNEDGEGELARALRVWLLSAVGEPQSALEDAKAWVDGVQDPTALAWASYGQQLEASGSPGGAADAYEKSLRKNSKQPQIRARRAQLLIEIARRGQALDEVIRVLSTDGLDDATIDIASAVAENLCDAFESQHRDDEVKRLLEYAGDYVDRSAGLLAHRARLAAVNGDLSTAKRDLKLARSLQPDLPIYDRVERLMRPARQSWWRW